MTDNPPNIPAPSPLDPTARWPDGLVLRPRTATDAGQIATLHNLPGYRYGTLRMPHHTPEEIRKGIDSQTANSLSLVAELGGTIVGDCGLTRHANNRRLHAGSIGMGVHDAFQGRGIGHALIGEILAVADRWFGLQRVELTVFTDNERAIRLYKRHGFEVEGTFRRFAFRDGHYVDAHSMARLGPTDVG